MKKLLTILFICLAFITSAQTVSITSSTSGSICAGTSVTFTATPSGFTNPYYQWYSNGIAISEATSSTYTSTNLNNSDQINVKVNEGPFGGAVTSNGLLLNLDATNPSSYPGSGSTWNNLVTGNEVTNFTLTAGGAYSSDNGGVIRFGNTGGGASSATGFSNLSAYTVEVWVKPAGTMGDYEPYVEGNTNYTPCFFSEKVYNSGTGNRVNMVLAYNARGLTSGTANNSYRYEAAINNGSWKKHQIPTNYSSDLNNWVQIISTYDGSKLTIYRNGVSLGSSAALGIASLRTPSIGYWISHRWDMSDGVYGDYSKVMMYNKALSQAEITANYNAFNARFVSPGISSAAITTTVDDSPSIPTLTVTGDACVNKSSLSATTGLSSYAWYKDDTVISGATTNTYTPSSAGAYKVSVSNGTCATTSSVTTIYTCGVTADGKMISTTFSAPLVSSEGGANFGTTIDEVGKILNTTGLTTTTGTIGATTAVLGGVISPTNAISSSIGVVYSTDANFATSSTSAIQSNVVAGTYATTLTGLSATTPYYAKSFITNKAGTSYGPVVSFTTASPPVAVGDVYQGGIVFYVLQSGDNGYDANVQHGLIAPFNSTSRQSTNPLPPIVESQIGLSAATISGASYDGTLLGKANTDAIIANQGSTGTYAALYCRNYANPTSKIFNSVTYTFPVYNDWYMPSIVEIHKFRAYLWDVHPSRGTYYNYGNNLIYYRGTSGDSNDYAWGKMLSSTMDGQRYKLYYVESGWENGSTAYDGWGENDRLVVMPIRSF